MLAIGPTLFYFHSDRYGVAYRIYPLRSDQKQQLLDFLLSVKATSSPLPILGDERNVGRINLEESIESTGIYRDIWEWKPLLLDTPDMRRRDVYDSLNYPTIEDFQQARERV
ncbi:hypothetical protein B7494_g6426 [Chlorociboria aeruginascens]|nr:hypothetical protein B7494_g6426 [Chlorociboria aeruginascens]